MLIPLLIQIFCIKVVETILRTLNREGIKQNLPRKILPFVSISNKCIVFYKVRTAFSQVFSQSICKINAFCIVAHHVCFCFRSNYITHSFKRSITERFQLRLNDFLIYFGDLCNTSIWNCEIQILCDKESVVKCFSWTSPSLFFWSINRKCNFKY